MREQREESNTGMERRSGFLSTPSTPHPDGHQQNQTWNVLAPSSKGQAGEKEKLFPSIPTIFPTLESDFHVCSEIRSLMMPHHRAPTFLLILQVSSMKQMLLWPQERAPCQLFSSFCWAILMWDRKEILFLVLCYTQRSLKQRRVLETWAQASAQISRTMQGEKGTPTSGMRWKFSDRKSRGSSCCPQKNPASNSFFFPVECASRASPLSQQE